MNNPSPNSNPRQNATRTPSLSAAQAAFAQALGSALAARWMAEQAAVACGAGPVKGEIRNQPTNGCP